MAKKGSFLCAFCNRRHRIALRTKEHIPGRRFYPKNTPNRVQRITVPACRECNDRNEVVERDVFIELALALAPGSPNVPGIQERLEKATRPDLTDDRIEKRARQKRRAEILSRIKTVEEVPENFMPGRSEPEGILAANSEGVIVPQYKVLRMKDGLVERLTEKCVRGLYFKRFGTPLDDGSTHLEAYVQRREVWQERIEWFSRFRHEGEGVGPGFSYRVVHDGGSPPLATIWELLIWGEYLLHATTLPPNELD